MTPDQINAAMAELEGLRVVRHDGVLCSAQPWPEIARPLPNYVSDLNACQRVLRGLDEETQEESMRHLVILTHDFKDMGPFLRLVLATPLQWCEAILRACGKWKEGE